MNKKQASPLLWGLILLIGCMPHRITPTTRTHHITIFIHGTVLPIPHPTAILKAWQAQPHESAYDAYLDQLRGERHFQEQLIGPRGLHKIDLSHYHAQTPHSKSCHDITQKYHLLNQAHNKQDAYSYYLYGWCGRLCASARERAGTALLADITQELANLKTLFPGDSFALSLVCHSHGGNVALHCAQALTALQHEVSIENIIMLGTPLQEETVSYAAEIPCKNIYNIYSTGDWLQKMDIFSSKNLGAKRSFHARPHQDAALAILPKNIHDIEIVIDGVKPAHAELWLTAGVPSPFYRKSFPLNPYPVVTLVPLIIEASRHLAATSQHLRLNLQTNKQNIFIHAHDKHTQQAIGTYYLPRKVQTCVNWHPQVS